MPTDDARRRVPRSARDSTAAGTGGFEGAFAPASN